MAYLSGWAIESIALFAASHWLREDDFEGRRALAVSLLAGAVWPVVTLGLVQYGAIAAVSKVLSDREAATAPSLTFGLQSFSDASVGSANPPDGDAMGG